MEGQSSQKNNEKKVHVKFYVPQNVVGVIIGKGGSMIKNIQEQFEVKLFVDNMGEAQTLIGMYGPEDGVHNATETIMKLLLSLRIIQTKLDEMGKPRTLRYVEEMTFLSLPEAGQPDWFVNLNKEQIQLENCDKKIPKQTEAAKTDMTESHSEEVVRGRPMLKSSVPPIELEKSSKSKSKAPPCLYKVKVVPKTESGLPDDRYETEAIALSVRTPVNYGLMVGTLRAGVENLPENFNLFMKIDNEWTKIPRPKNNENDSEIWDEYFVNQPKASRVLYLVETLKVKKTKPDDEKFGTKPEQKNPKTETETEALAEKIKSMELEMAKEKSKNVQQSKELEEQKRELVKLRSQQKDVKEKPDRAGRISDLDSKMRLTTNASQDSKNETLLTPVLNVTPTACTVPAAWGDVTFQLFNSGPQRFVFEIGMKDFSVYTVNPACAFVEAGATASLKLTRLAGSPKDNELFIHSATVSLKATDARVAVKAKTRFECIKIPVLATADKTVTTLTTSSLSPTAHSSKFLSNGTVEQISRPFLKITPTACTAPVAGGKVTFQLFNPGPQRLVFEIRMPDFSDYTVNPAYAFVEAGATAGLKLTRKSGPLKDNELFIYSATVSPKATDARVAFKAKTRFECIKIPVLAN